MAVVRAARCILVSRHDHRAIVGAVRPLMDVDPLDAGSALKLCEKLYRAGLEFERDANLSEQNVEMTYQDCMILNHCVKEGDWATAGSLLQQTWRVLRELETDTHLPEPRFSTDDLYPRVVADIEATLGGEEE